MPIDETQPVLKQDDHASEREATPPSRRQIIYSHQEKRKKRVADSFMQTSEAEQELSEQLSEVEAEAEE